MLRYLVALFGLFAVACSTRQEGPRLRVEVAPLTLPEVAEACYSLAITNEAGEPVMSRAGLCASDYGAAGGLSYVAPCDASDPNNDGVATQTVTLTIDGLYREGGDPVVFIDPCAAPHSPGGCVLQTTCAPNGDTPVRFDLTIMREAEQGFFDIAVGFEDVFCAAKVDCLGDDGPLTLLHHPLSGEREQTAVIAFACAAGPGTQTALLHDRVTLRCGENVIELDPTAGPGNAWGTGVGQTADPLPNDPFWQYAVYAGREDLQCQGQSCEKVYWNLALGFTPTSRDCRLTTRATALERSRPGFSTAPGAYPYVDFDVQLTTDSDTPTLACTRHGLNVLGSGVTTRYTPLTTPRAFFARYDGTQFTTGACPEGWTGPGCATPVCTDICIHGSCDAPNTCTCESGWEGETCEQAICADACVNGSCDAPNTCVCDGGWDGPSCDEAICSEPCVNGSCDTPNTCICDEGWSGLECDVPVVLPAPDLVRTGLVLELDAGLASSYPGTGTTWTDLAGDNDGALGNGPSFRSNHEGGLVFNGTNQRVTVANHASLNPTQATWGVWFNASALANATHGDGLIAKGVAPDGNAGAYEILLVPSGTKNSALCRMHNGETRSYGSGAVLELGVAYQVVCAYDGANLKLYINGVEVGAGLATSGPLSATSDVLSIAKRTAHGELYDSFFSGTIHAAHVYGRGLSASEVAQNFRALRGRFYDTRQPGVVTAGRLVDLEAPHADSYGGVGTTWFDLSGQGRHGTLVNGPVYSWPDRAFALDGADDRVTVPGVALAASHTLEVWFNPASVTGPTLIASPNYFADGFPGNFIVRLANATTLAVNMYNGRTSEEARTLTLPSIALNQWHHLVLARNGGVMTVYLNGVSRGTMSFTHAPSDAVNGLVLGDDVSSTNASFNGKVGGFRVYNRALGASEVAQNLAATRHAYELRVAYDLAAKSTFFPFTTTRLADLTGRGIDGTIAGAVSRSADGGGSLQFPGGTARVTMGSSLGNGFPQITVMAWVKQSTLISGYYTIQSIVDADDGGTGGIEGVYGLSFQSFSTTASLPASFVGRHVVFGVRSASQSNRDRPVHIADNSEWSVYLPGLAIAKNPAGLVANEWVHLAGVYTGSETKVYVNGVLAGSSTNQPDGQNRSVSGVLNSSSIERTIGAMAGTAGAGLVGNVRAVKIYRAALSDAEIAAEFMALDATLNP